MVFCISHLWQGFFKPLDIIPFTCTMRGSLFFGVIMNTDPDPEVGIADETIMVEVRSDSSETAYMKFMINV